MMPQADAQTRDESLRPPAIAQGWVGEGVPHQTIAVPGVALREGDVLVAIELATVCGSDVHTVAGHRTAPTPLVLGHEYVGRIVAIARVER
jgi:D-arabinose 1-dehydrogenase-like Zn-dependent alcohol dehydrogenase